MREFAPFTASPFEARDPDRADPIWTLSMLTVRKPLLGARTAA
jgi:hypothetical protein